MQGRRAVALAVAAQGTSVVPLVLLGTMAVSIRRDLGFDESELGAVITLCFGVAAVLSLVSGRIVDLIGASAGVRVAGVSTALGSGGLALFASSWSTSMLQLALIGLGVALVQPATDALLTQQVEIRRHGMAFALKQTAGGPAIGLLAGLAVPLLATTLGWRAAFATGAVASVVVVLVTAKGQSTPKPERRARKVEGYVPMRSFKVLAVGGFAATIAQSAFVAFAVSAAVRSGMSEGTGGLLFAGGSALAIAVRLGGGHLADRRAGGLLTAIAAMMVLGVVGFALLATGHVAAVVVAVPLLCASAWGWPGLYFLAIARISRGSTSASGAAAAALLAGGVLGPLLLGQLAIRSYAMAWTAGAACSVGGSLLVLLGRRLLLKDSRVLVIAK